MKRLIGVAVAIAIALGGAGFASAQGTSSYNQPVESATYTPPAPKPTAGYDGGFFVKSGDGDWKLKIGTRVDTMFYYESENVPNDASTAENESLDTLTFRLRRAQLLAFAYWKKLRAFILVGTGVPGNTYWVGNIKYSITDDLYVVSGVDDPQYGMMSVMSSKKMTMVDFPITTTQKDGEAPVWTQLPNAITIVRPSLGLPTQIGLFLGGSHVGGRFNWGMSVGNGTESTDSLNLNRQFTYAIRLSGVPVGSDPYGDMTDYAYSETPSLGFGIGGNFEHDDAFRNAGTAAAPIWLKMYNWAMGGTVDAAFRYRGFSINLSSYYRAIKVGPGATVEAGEKYLSDVAYLATIAMFAIPKKLEFQGFGSQIFREGPDNNVYEFGGGINYYINGHQAKIQLDYSRVIDYDDITGTNNRARNRVRAKMQLYF